MFIFYMMLTTILVYNCAEPAKGEMLQYGDASDHYSVVEEHTNKYVLSWMKMKNGWGCLANENHVDRECERCPYLMHHV